MRKFNENIKTKLYQLIEDIEKKSSVELVLIIQPQIRGYYEVALVMGISTLLAVYTFLMFTTSVIDVYTIYYCSVMAFFIGFSVVYFIHPIKRLLIGKKKLEREVDIYSRAVFQKAGIRHTSKETGVLIFVSLFERKLKILADRGVENNVPTKDWENQKVSFENLFKAKDIEQELIRQLNNCSGTFTKSLPSTEDDINELPDKMEVKFQ